jgi:hypothetical protein
MSLNIRKRFLHNPKQGCFVFPGEPSQVLRKIDLYVDAAPRRKPRRVPLKCEIQPSVLEQRRVKEIGESPNRLNHAIAQLKRFFDSVPRRRGQLRGHVSDAAERQPQRRQILCRCFMQVERDAPPLFVLCIHQACREAPQVLLRLLDSAVGQRILYRNRGHLRDAFGHFHVGGHKIPFFLIVQREECNDFSLDVQDRNAQDVAQPKGLKRFTADQWIL